MVTKLIEHEATAEPVAAKHGGLTIRVTGLRLKPDEGFVRVAVQYESALVCYDHQHEYDADGAVIPDPFLDELFGKGIVEFKANRVEPGAVEVRVYAGPDKDHLRLLQKGGAV